MRISHHNIIPSEDATEIHQRQMVALRSEIKPSGQTIYPNKPYDWKMELPFRPSSKEELADVIDLYPTAKEVGQRVISISTRP